MSEPVCPVCGSDACTDYPTPFPDRLRRCGQCGARFVHPLPAPDELRARYEREHASGKWAALFDVADQAEPPRRARLIRRLAGGVADRPLLDVGCGDGAFLDAAHAEGWRTLGLEIAVEASRRVAGRHPVVVGTPRAIRPAKGRSVGLGAVTFWDVLEHLPDPRTVVADAAALLAPGGVLAASMPNARGTEALLGGPGWRYHDLAAYGHLLHLGPAQLAALMTDVGLRVVHRETRGSVDLRNLAVESPVLSGSLRGPATWLLDRASGVLARIAEPLLRGNTLLLVGRKSLTAPAREAARGFEPSLRGG